MGFHHPFETTLHGFAQRGGLGLDLAGRRRAPLLQADLMALGVAPAALARLPQYAGIGVASCAAAAMGALYVIEGSTLGGIHIARALAPLCAALGGGRRFFLGHGERHGAMWRGFLAALEARAASEADIAAMVEGAATTFAAFEFWMNGWRSMDEAADPAMLAPLPHDPAAAAYPG